MKKPDEMTCHQALKYSHILFCGGWLLAAGAALLIAGLVLAVLKVRCPHCGASLMPGGRLPLSMPPYCSGCGKKL